MTNFGRFTLRQACRLGAALALLALMPLATPGVLPEDRADVLFHRYDGGGVVIQGPSVLVRKKFKDKVSVVANYYQDMVSSASIDVLSTASKYSEKRTQTSLGVDYLRGKSTYSVGVIRSKETDYLANTAYFNISQDMFGDLTTVSFGFRRGSNDVYRNIKVAGVKQNDPNFKAKMDSRAYSAGLTQVITRNLIGTLAFEVDTDEGFLNSPYRSVRYVSPGGAGFQFDAELYPKTHTSNAASARLRYFLPWRAAVDGQYRFYTDSWGVKADTLQLEYTHPAWHSWVFDARYRFYKQNAADFYSDLFPRRNALNFQARDKELAAYKENTIGFTATYEFKIRRAPWLEKSSVNLSVDHMMINYDNFRDITKSTPATVGIEPLYKLNANIFQLFISAWF
jgi:hypothetical protein